VPPEEEKCDNGVEEEEEEEEKCRQSVEEIVKIIEEARKGVNGTDNNGGLGLIDGSIDLDDIDDADIYDDVDDDEERNGDFVCAL
jgi:serine/threonine-protein kinase SRK2